MWPIYNKMSQQIKLTIPCLGDIGLMCILCVCVCVCVCASSAVACVRYDMIRHDNVMMT